MTKQPAENINTEMQRQAEETVQVASKRFNTQLDFSEKSLAELDKLLDQAWIRFVQLRSEDKLTDEIINRTVEAWGSYFGELVRRQLGGQWAHKDAWPVLLFDQLEFSPMDEVYQRLTDEPHYTMVNRYTEIARQIPPSSQPEESPATPAYALQEAAAVPAEGLVLAAAQPERSALPASTSKRRTWLLIGTALLVILLVACLATAISLRLLTL